MAIVAPPNPETRKFAKFLSDHEERIKRVERGLQTAQLGTSSIHGAGIDMFDPNGIYRGTVGFQNDGTTTVTSQNPDPPVVPGSPIVTPGIASLIVKHTGETQDGSSFLSDWSHLNIYTADPGLPEVRTLRGSLRTLPDEFPVTGLDYASYLVTVTAVNMGLKESGHSVPSSGIPIQVVSADLIAGAIQEIHLSNNIVSAATLKANAVTATKISDDAIETRHLTAGSIDTAALAANSVNASKIVAASITGDRLVALTITANEIATNAITAGKISAGSVTAVKLEANMVIASRIIAGNASGARVEMHPTLGLQAYLADNVTRTFWINASTGAAFFMGQIETATSGTRIVINPGGTTPDQMLFYEGAGFASISAVGGQPGGVVISIQGPTTDRGVFNVGPAEAIMGWATGVSYRSYMRTNGLFATIIGGEIFLECTAQNSGNDVIRFGSRNAAGGQVGATGLTFRGAGSDEASLYSSWFNTQIVWTTTGLVIQNGAGTVGKEIVASNVAPSSRATKKNIKAFVLPNEQTYVDIVDALVPKQWNYKEEVTIDDPDPPKRMVEMDGDWIKDKKTGEFKTDKLGNVQVGNKKMVEAPAEPKTKPHFGLIAEEVLDVLPDIVQENPDIPGGLGLSDRDITAILWMAVRELIQEVRELRGNQNPE